MLKWTIGIVSLGLSTVCLSAPGFYVGIGGGPEGAKFSEDATITQPKSFDARQKQELSGDGFFGSIFAGYGWSHKDFYLAGEINANRSTVEHTESNKELIHKSSSSTDFTVNRSYGVSVLPGYLYSPCTLFYARLGYVQGDFESDTSDVSLFNKNTMLDGFRYGLGIKKTVYKQISVLMEYSQVHYQEVHGTTFDALSATTKKTVIHPLTAQVEFGAVYNFS